MSVLNFIFDHLQLFDTDRAMLRRKRGFTDAQIDDMQVGSTGNYLRDVLMEASTRYGLDTCIAAGLFTKQRGGFKPWYRYLDTGNVIIPYFHGDEIVMLRPHKYTPTGQGVQPYFCRAEYNQRAVTIGAESEFKARAAEAYGYQAFGIPGISSFSGQHFNDLLTRLRDRGIRNIVWLFDNEDKSSPESPRFKKLARDRWDTPFWAYVMARQCNEAREAIYSRVAWIPDRYRDKTDYKADIDGLLAAGVPEAEFAAIVDAAVDPPQFLEQLPEEALAVINRKVLKRFEEGAGQRLSKSQGRYMYATEEGPRVVSNFTAEYVCTLQDRDGQRSYELRLTNVNGQVASIRATAKEYTDTRKFRTLVGGPGLFWWSGRDDGLQEMFDSVVPAEEKIVNLRERSIGWDEELEHYFFTNCAVDGHGNVVEYQADGSVAIDGQLWRIADTVGDLPELHFAAGGTVTDAKGRAELARLLHENFNLEEAVLALAWMCAAALKPWVFPINRTFPILFVFGRKGSGKTRLMQWLTRIFFNRDKGSTDVLMGQATAPFIRNRATQTPYLPFWMDEYRNQEHIMRHLDMLRGIYDHSSAGISGGAIGTNKQFSMRCALAISGEDVPNDETLALNERMITVRLHDKPDGRHFNMLEQLQYGFDGIFVGLLREREKLVPAIRAEYDRLVEAYRRRGPSGRVAINYAMLFAVARAAMGWAPSEDLVDKIFEGIRADERENDPVVEMLRVVGDYWPALGDIRLKHAAETKLDPETQRVVLVFNLQRCHDAYAVAHSRTRANIVPAVTMKRLVAGSQWAKPFGAATRVGGRPCKAWVVDLDHAPTDLQQVAHTITDDDSLKYLLEQRYGTEEGSLPPQYSE